MGRASRRNPQDDAVTVDSLPTMTSAELAGKITDETGSGAAVFGTSPTLTLQERAVTAGITASVTQSQGEGALTADINEVSVCATTNDTVTLPTAAAGLKITVINNGAETLQVFPASGDDLGAGVDTATTVDSGAEKVFLAYDATNWEEIGGGAAGATNYCGVFSSGVLTYYADPATALAAASSGDLMIVFQGIFDQINLFKDGVDQYWYPGTGINYTGSDNGAIFDDSATGTNGSVACTIGGHGEFIRAGTGSSDHTLHVSNASSIVTVTCERLRNQTLGDVIKHANGDLIVNVNQLDSGSASHKLINITCGSGDISVINVDYAESGSIHNAGASNETNIAINRAISIASFQNTSSGTMTLEGEVFTLSGSAGLIQNTSSGKMYVDANEITWSGSSAGIRNTSTGIQRVTARLIDGASTTGFNIQCTNGTQVINAETIESNDGTLGTINGTGGTQRITANRIINVNANGEAILLGGQALELYGTPAVISGASATDSITASSGETMKIYGTAYLNKALNANVTVQVGGYVPSDANVT